MESKLWNDIQKVLCENTSQPLDVLEIRCILGKEKVTVGDINRILYQKSDTYLIKHKNPGNRPGKNKSKPLWSLRPQLANIKAPGSEPNVQSHEEKKEHHQHHIYPTPKKDGAHLQNRNDVQAAYKIKHIIRGRRRGTSNKSLKYRVPHDHSYNAPNVVHDDDSKACHPQTNSIEANISRIIRHVPSRNYGLDACYLYALNVITDIEGYNNKRLTSVGILLPNKIPDSEVQHIRFAVTDRDQHTQTMVILRYISSTITELREIKTFNRHIYKLMDHTLTDELEYNQQLRFCYFVQLARDKIDYISMKQIRSKVQHADDIPSYIQMVPEIIWNVEHWLNICVDLKEKLQSLSEHIQIDTLLLYQSMQRDAISNNSCHILSTQGAYAMEAMLTLFQFCTNINADANVITRYVAMRIDHKSKIWRDAADKLDLLKFCRNKRFLFAAWNPPGFNYRSTNSLNCISNDANIKRDLLQAICGVCLRSYLLPLNQDTTLLFSCAIKSVLALFYKLGITKLFQISPAFKEVKNENISLTMNAKHLKEVATTQNVVDNPLFRAALNTVCGEEHYQQYGVKLSRLSKLGKSLIDIAVSQHICRSISYQAFNVRVNDMQRTHNNWSMFITDERHKWVNNKCLAECMMTLQEYVSNNSKTQKKNVHKFAQRMMRHHKYQSKKTFGDDNDADEKAFRADTESVVTDITNASNINDVNRIRLQPITPKKGINKDAKHSKLGKIQKDLSVKFQALVGAIFLGSNYDLFVNKHTFDTATFQFAPVIEFLMTFLGNHSAWKKTMSIYTCKLVDVTSNANKRVFNRKIYQQINRKMEIDERSKWFFDDTCCPQCSKRKCLLFLGGNRHKEIDGNEDWDKNAVLVNKIRNDIHCEYLLERHEFENNVDQYRCEICQYYVQHHVNIYKEYCSKKLSNDLYKVKKTAITPLIPMNVDSNENMEADRPNWLKIKECDLCQQKMKLFAYRQTEKEKFKERNETHHCDACALYWNCQQIYIPLKRALV